MDDDFREPFIWLQERETRGEAVCGCVLEYLPDASVVLCPMHEAAPALLDALRDARRDILYAYERERASGPQARYGQRLDFIDEAIRLATEGDAS